MFSFRPFFPLEPLVAGVLAASSGGAVAPAPPPLPSFLSAGTTSSSSSSSEHDSFDTERLLDGSTLDVLRRFGWDTYELWGYV